MKNINKKEIQRKRAVGEVSEAAERPRWGGVGRWRCMSTDYLSIYQLLIMNYQSFYWIARSRNGWVCGCLLSLRAFGLLSSSLLSFPQRFGRYSSGVCRTRELRTMSFIESTLVACFDSVSHNRVQVLSIPILLLACS